MRWYWTKIVVGALVIFGVGAGILSVARAARREVVHVVEGSGDITVPVPFVPFLFDGTEAGKLRRLVIHRSSPKQVTGFDLTVRVSDQAVLEQLGQGCRLTVKDANRIGNDGTPFNTPFQCASADSDYRDFGSVTIQGKDEAGDWVTRVTVPLVLPDRVIRDFDGSNLPRQVQRTEANRLRQLGDSLGRLGRRMGRADAGERVQIQAQMDDLRAQMQDISQAMAESISQQVTDRINQSVKIQVRSSSGAKVEATVDAPAAPKPPSTQ